MKRQMPNTPEWLRATSAFRTRNQKLGVDREAKAIRGFVVAQRGPFKTDGRGEFDTQSLRTIVDLMNREPKGLKSRFAHPTLSDDGLGKYLGRARNARLDVDRVRADLFFDDSAFNTPSGDLASYVMDLADSDPDAISSSLVLRADQEEQLAKDGRSLKDEHGNPLPPLWRPTSLHATDIVDTGDAVDGILSAELPDSAVRQGCELLDKVFDGQDRDAVESRLSAFAERYLMWRYGPPKTFPLSKAEGVLERIRGSKLLT